MAFPASFYLSRWYCYWFNWQNFWFIYHQHRHIDRLENLKAWARRKRLTKVFRYYDFIQTDKNIRLSRLAMRSPELAKWASLLYQIMKLVSPEPRHYRGAAAMYKMSNLKY